MSEFKMSFEMKLDYCNRICELVVVVVNIVTLFQIYPIWEKKKNRGKWRYEFLYFIFSSFCQLSILSGNSTSSTIVSSNAQAGSISWIESEKRLNTSSNSFIKRLAVNSFRKVFFGGVKAPTSKQRSEQKKKLLRMLWKKVKKKDGHTFGLMDKLETLDKNVRLPLRIKAWKVLMSYNSWKGTKCVHSFLVSNEGWEGWL